MKENEDIFKKNPFTVPPGYFEQLTDVTSFRAKMQQEQKKDGFGVPDAYFDRLTDRIKDGIFVESLKNESENVGGWTVPQGYFPDLEQRILAKTAKLEDSSRVKLREPVKLRRLEKRRTPAWLAYAAAACMLFVGGLFIKNSMNTPELDLGTIPEEELVNYLTLYGGTGDYLLFSEAMVEWDAQADEGVEFIPDLSDEEIEWYLENTF